MESLRQTGRRAPNLEGSGPAALKARCACVWIHFLKKPLCQVSRVDRRALIGWCSERHPVP